MNKEMLNMAAIITELVSGISDKVTRYSDKNTI